jgi:virulence-associated protein VapD
MAFAAKKPRADWSVGGIGHNSERKRSVFAIAFDLDTTVLKESYKNESWQNAYNDVGKTLRAHGFDRMQGSVYFGNDRVDAVTCVLAVQQLTVDHAWFAPAVRDIRMLRIEDNNDLMPAVERALK